MTMKIIKYTPALDIRNISQLPRGTGAKYLIVIKGPSSDIFIAKRWARKKPKKLSSQELLISF